MADVIFRLAIAAGCDIDHLCDLCAGRYLWRDACILPDQLLLRQPPWHKQASTYPFPDSKRARS